jgi:hypothetical protein
MKLRFKIVFALLAVLVVGPNVGGSGAIAKWQSVQQVVIPAPSATYAFIGNFAANTSSATISNNFNLGSNPTCYVIVGVRAQNGSAVSAITVGSTSLTQLVASSTFIFSGLYGASLSSCSGSQTVSATITGSAFSDQGMAVWVATNLTSTTPVGTGSDNAGNPVSASLNINGDFIFAFTAVLSGGATITYSSSTSAPTRADTPFTASGVYLTSADWSTPTTNPSFNVEAVFSTGPAGGLAVASFH